MRILTAATLHIDSKFLINFMCDLLAGHAPRTPAGIRDRDPHVLNIKIQTGRYTYVL